MDINLTSNQIVNRSRAAITEDGDLEDGDNDIVSIEPEEGEYYRVDSFRVDIPDAGASSGRYRLMAFDSQIASSNTGVYFRIDSDDGGEISINHHGLVEGGDFAHQVHPDPENVDFDSIAQMIMSRVFSGEDEFRFRLWNETGETVTDPRNYEVTITEFSE